VNEVILTQFYLALLGFQDSIGIFFRFFDIYWETSRESAISFAGWM
jgi:hypothetical protein